MNNWLWEVACMNVAFIPVRGGSKSIPLKNIKKLCGRPLVYWTVKAACECKHIDKIYVATDSEDIKNVVTDFCDNELFSKVEVIGRSQESATDTASTEFAMLEFAKTYSFDNIVLIQATSPLLSSLDLINGFNAYMEKNVDSVLSVVKQKRFIWRIEEDGCGYPCNYDVFNRPRRQEFDGYFVENGAFYITSKENLMRYKNRLSGNICLVEMHEDSFFEIDELSDWNIIESLMKKHMNEDGPMLGKVKAFFTDCDGCLTDAGMYYSEKGDELKKFNTKDGMAFNILQKAGIITGIITGENVSLNERRANKLKVQVYISNCKNKLRAVKDICSKYGLELKNIAYMGDDINDIEILREVGFSCAPADAVSSVRNIVDYVTTANGGEGAFREVVDFIMNRMMLLK